ncbi:hypothetical protein M0R45_025926 [Rubus argutus]|uniref:Uncharacterized protein n=1 Tax=Rubus argutus TaxID=59490 RepID=A0AAW1WXT4_RUBAR
MEVAGERCGRKRREHHGDLEDGAGEAKEIDGSAMGRGRKDGAAAGLWWWRQRTVAEESWATALEVVRGTWRCRLGGSMAEKMHGFSRSWLGSAWATADGETTASGVTLWFGLRFALVLNDGGSAVMADGLMIENREKRVVIYGIVIATWWGSEHGELRIEDGDCSWSQSFGMVEGYPRRNKEGGVGNLRWVVGIQGARARRGTTECDARDEIRAGLGGGNYGIGRSGQSLRTGQRKRWWWRLDGHGLGRGKKNRRFVDLELLD